MFFLLITLKKKQKNQKKEPEKRAEIQNIFLALQITCSFQRNIYSENDLLKSKSVFMLIA